MPTENQTAQLNVEVPKTIGTRLRVEAAKHNRSLNDVATIIFKDFLNSWTAKERAAFYAELPPKRKGRPFAQKEVA